MLFVLSPAKSLDYETPTRVSATEPRYVAEAAELIGILRQRSPAEIAELMDLSDTLATLNVARYGAWQPASDRRNSKPAVLAFNGDVYDGLDARSLGAADLRWAQSHVLILSGLYGLLRPLDALQPYRLEMGTRLANPRGKDLYDWWGDTISLDLAERLAGERSPVLVNLASQEYFKAVRRPVLQAAGPVRVVDCVFEDWKDGDYKIISFHAKRARGLMARYAITKRVQRVSQLLAFDLGGYVHAPEVSGPDRLVFRRRQEG
ncbi:peroxide stress protein YaaA [Leptothrix sp. BB-4]